MNPIARRAGLSLALVAVGCGRPKASFEGSSTDTVESVDASSAEEVTSTDSSTPATDTGTGTGTSTGGPTGPTNFMDFVPNNDDSWGSEECDPFAQDCPEGEKCVPYGSTGGIWDANKCVPVTGDRTTGDSCAYGGTVEATDECDEDNLCWNVEDVDGMLIGTCAPFCGGTADDPTCPLDRACLIAYEGSLAVCLLTCDPLIQDCGEGQGCYWGSDDFVCLLDDDSIPAGEACVYFDECAAGNLCLEASLLPACEDPSCCAPLCDLQAGGDPCATLPGTTCVPFFEPNNAPPGFEQVGVCTLP